jgi:hypothetical protein
VKLSLGLKEVRDNNKKEWNLLYVWASPVPLDGCSGLRAHSSGDEFGIFDVYFLFFDFTKINNRIQHLQK